VKILIYQYDSSTGQVAEQSDHAKTNYRLVLWRPTLTDWIPPGKGKKYIIYTLFHLLGVFKNKDYASMLVFHGNTLISSLLIVPAYYKWPFMKKNDLQFTYVITHKSYRGQGLAEQAISYAVQRLKAANRVFWYVTDETNIPSIRLCEKIGFKFFEYGKNTGLLKKVEKLS
jgi:GNAT superfamily N-acetyltransferase